MKFKDFFFLICFIPSTLTAQAVEDKIEQTINQMSLSEKIKQLHKLDAMTTETNQRLNIPGFIMSDGPHGVRDGLATSFPVGIAMAATWDLELARRVGMALGKEFRGKSKNQMLGPAIDLTRDPRNGRSPESGGEDPYLNAMINAEIIKGVQTTPVIATAKHFNCKHKQINRNSNNYTMTRRWLMDHYGLNFRTAVQDAGVFSIMSAYNRINGQQAAEQYELLTTILRQHWGFPFYVVSDWGAVHDSKKAITAGTDVCMGSDHYQNDLYNLVLNGQVSEATINEALRRVLRTKIMSGLLDYYPPGDPADVNSDAHKLLCLEAGKKSLVLLKNENNILPLNKDSLNSILLVGPNATVMQTDGSGSSWVTPFYTVTPKQGIEHYVDPAKVFYFQGCDFQGRFASDLSQALQKAQDVDMVIFWGGLDPSQEGEGFDRANGSILLPGRQNEVIKYLSLFNKNLVVVLFSGGICTVSPFIDEIKGLIYAFYPGQEGGNAIAQVLFGDYNPGGKLPVTMPKSDYQLHAEITDFDFTNDFGCGYRWFDKKDLSPQFAFGFGLGYTTFSYRNLTITPAVAPIGEIVEVRVDLTNSGSKKGEEVVQLYLSYDPNLVDLPEKELRGFKKIELAPNETKTVTFQLSPNELYLFNEAVDRYEVRPMTYTVRVGGSSDNLPLMDTFTLTPTETKADLQIASLKSAPPYPLQGDQVQFFTTIINRGTGPSPQGISHEVVFTVDGQPVSKAVELQHAIPAGGMAVAYGTIGVGGDYFWTADGLGEHTLQAIVNPEGSISETKTENNSKAVTFQVYDLPPANLALNKTVHVTSIENESLAGKNAVDGDYSSRWSSQFSDPQFLIINLGSVQHFSQIRLYWETAYGKEYRIDISNDLANWTTIVNQTNGLGGAEAYNVDATAKYVRMYGIKRGTQWGYSLYEIELYDAISSNDNSVPIEDFKLFNNYPNPFNSRTTISYQLLVNCRVTLKVYDILARAVSTLVDEFQSSDKYKIEFDATGLANGVYFYQLTTNEFVKTRKMVVLK